MRWWRFLMHVLFCGDAGVRLDPNTHTYKCNGCGFDMGDLDE